MSLAEVVLDFPCSPPDSSLGRARGPALCFFFNFFYFFSWKGFRNCHKSINSFFLVLFFFVFHVLHFVGKIISRVIFSIRCKYVI